MSIHRVSTVGQETCSAVARHTNDKLLPSRNSQSKSALPASWPSPTVEMAKKVKGKRHNLQLSVGTQDPGTFPGPPEHRLPRLAQLTDLQQKSVFVSRP